jgi:hypothetical protein
VNQGFVNNGVIELTNSAGGGNPRGATLVVTSGTLLNVGTLRSLEGTAGGFRTLTATLDNQGAVEVFHNLLLDAASAAHSNSGTIEISDTDADTLMVEQSGSSPSFTTTGAVTIASGGTWTVSSGTLVHAAGTIGGPGTLKLDGATMDVTPDLSVVGTLELDNSTINGSGSVTVAEGASALLYDGAINTDLDLQGDLVAQHLSALGGTVTTGSVALLRVEGTAGFNATLTVDQGFVNNGELELSNSFGDAPRNASLKVNTGFLVNEGIVTADSGSESGGGARTIDAFFDNRGTLSVQTPLTVTGQLIVPAAADAPEVSGNGSTLTVTGVDLDGVTFDNVPLVTNNGLLALNDVTFQNIDPDSTQLTVNHPGNDEDAEFEFTNITFMLLTVGPPGYYISANDNSADGNTLKIAFLDASPEDGSTYVELLNSAEVRWTVTPP